VAEVAVAPDTLALSTGRGITARKEEERRRKRKQTFALALIAFILLQLPRHSVMSHAVGLRCAINKEGKKRPDITRRPSIFVNIRVPNKNILFNFII
jgi:hypothetical protein